MKSFILIAIAMLHFGTMASMAAARTDNWGLGAHIGGGEMLGFHGKKDQGPVQFRLHFGFSMTDQDRTDTYLSPDTLNTRSLDQIGGFSIRGYLFDMFFVSTGISMNDRRIETNIEKNENNTDLDISTHQYILEAPCIIGVEFRRRKSVSMYLEAGYVFQLDKPGETVILKNSSYTAIYKHPFGIPTVGVGVAYNFLR